MQDPWGNWTDIPGSDASTLSYRLGGLSSGTGHRFEVRPVVGAMPGPPSNVFWGTTRAPGQYPSIAPRVISEGDGRTEWSVSGLPFVVTIPDGVRLQAHVSVVPAGGEPALPVHVIPEGAGVLFSIDGRVLSRYVPPPAAVDGNAATAARDLDALLTQIIGSLRHVD